MKSLYKKILTGLILIVLSVFVAAQSKDVHFQHLNGLERTNTRKTIHFPDIQGYVTLTADLHMHTIFSDGEVTPRIRVQEAWREGLDAIAMTDHDFTMRSYIQGDYNTSYELAKIAADQAGIILIRGLEYTRSKPIGHWNFLFISEANQYVNTSLSHEEIFKKAHDEGAFIMYNHPGWPDKNSDLSAFQLDMINKGYVQGIEVMNGAEFYPLAVDYCSLYKLAPLGCTDIHGPIHASYDVENAHRNLTLIFAKDRSHDALKEALFERRTLAYANNTLAGDPGFMFAFMRASLDVLSYDEDEFRFAGRFFNNSDITWVLDGPEHRRIIIPARQTIAFGGQKQDVNIMYQVSNTYISSVDHLEVSLYSLFASDNEVMMPSTRQNLHLLSPQDPIVLQSVTPNAEIRYTLDDSEPTESAMLYSGPFTLSRSAVIKARAFAPGMKPSRTFKTQAILDVLHPAERIRNLKNGIKYRYYEGAFQSVIEITQKGTFKKEGVLSFPDISIADAEDYFGMIFSGYIYIPADGLYTFILESDDGSTLDISGVRLINNDGSHSLKRESNSMKLQRGYHPITIHYFDDYAEEALNLYWIRPGQSEEKVAPSFFFVP